MLRDTLLIFTLCWTGCGGKVSDLAEPGQPSGPDNSTTAGGATAGGATAGGATVSVPIRLTPISSDVARSAVEQACEGYTVEVESMLLASHWLVDASSSMGAVAPGSSNSKWNLTRAAVLDGMTRFLFLHPGDCSGRRASLHLYPGQATDRSLTTELRPVDTCVNVNGATATATATNSSGMAADLTAVTGLLDAANPLGGTPTLDAYRAITMGVNSAAAAVDSVVLVTDGQPSIAEGCRNVDANSSYDTGASATTQPIVEAIAAAFARGIRTFVAGTPGSESARSWLSLAAVAGGTASPNCDPKGDAPYCHLDLTTQPDALRVVAEAYPTAPVWATCNIGIPTFSDGTAINPTVTMPIVSDADGRHWRVPYDPGPASDCSEGFRLSSPNEITICPAACEFLQANACNSPLMVLFFCSEFEPGTIN